MSETTEKPLYEWLEEKASEIGWSEAIDMLYRDVCAGTSDYIKTASLPYLQMMEHTVRAWERASGFDLSEVQRQKLITVQFAGLMAQLLEKVHLEAMKEYPDQIPATHE